MFAVVMRDEKVAFPIERRHFHFFMDEAENATAPNAGVVFEENVLSAMIAAEGFHRWVVTARRDANGIGVIQG